MISNFYVVVSKSSINKISGDIVIGLLENGNIFRWNCTDNSIKSIIGCEEFACRETLDEKRGNFIFKNNHL